MIEVTLTFLYEEVSQSLCKLYGQSVVIDFGFQVPLKNIFLGMILYRIEWVLGTLEKTQCV